jgi:rhomboid family protein
MALYPVASEQPTMRPALANLAIIGLNVFVFLLEILLGDTFIETWAFTPAQLTAFFHGSGSFQSVLTIFTSMFMHAGWNHTGLVLALLVRPEQRGAFSAA